MVRFCYGCARTAAAGQNLLSAAGLPRYYSGMANDADNADKIDEQVAQDVADGVSRFTDGTNAVESMDPHTRLDVADRLRRREAAKRGDLGLRSIRLRGGPGGF